MLEKIPMRLRFSLLTAILLTACCLGLTIVLNFTAYKLVDKLDAAVITTPAESLIPPIIGVDGNIIEAIPAVPLQSVREAKRGFSVESIIYMLVIIVGGSLVTYYVSGKALRPLDTLSGQVKNMNVHNLSETLDVPHTRDEIADLTEAFNEMSAKLNEAFLMQKRFSASAAHELRTPLAVIQTKVDVFKKKSEHSIEEYQKLVDVFDKQIVRLRGLVGNLLDMTNTDDDIEKSDVILRDVFSDIIDELSQIAGEKAIVMSLNCDDCVICGNVDLLYRAFYNLVENAIKYNGNGGSVDINVSKDANGQVEIMVCDSGIGVPNEMKKSIFEPFCRVDKSRSRAMGGAGLGLAIVKSIVDKHNGTISVEDNASEGSCFKVTI